MTHGCQQDGLVVPGTFFFAALIESIPRHIGYLEPDRKIPIPTILPGTLNLMTCILNLLLLSMPEPFEREMQH